DRDHGADRGALSLAQLELADDPRDGGLELHVGLVRLDLGEDLAGLDAIARSLEPAQQLALLHGVGELGHRHLGHLRLRAMLLRPGSAGPHAPRLSPSPLSSSARTGANERRWIGLGPRLRRARRWAAVP